jgi:AcrR family transcriptional regulator
MGRPTLIDERREQILAAFCRCLAKAGLEGTTLDAVAAEAGVQRAAIRHYVGNRDELVRACMEYLAVHYERDLAAELEAAPKKGRMKHILDRMFLGHTMTDSSLQDDAFDALLAAAVSDKKIRRSLLELYLVFEARIAEEIAAAYPNASAKIVAATAYAILCMIEQNNEMLWLGFPDDRAKAARDVAYAMLKTLS